MEANPVTKLDSNPLLPWSNFLIFLTVALLSSKLAKTFDHILSELIITMKVSVLMSSKKQMPGRDETCKYVTMGKYLRENVGSRWLAGNVGRSDVFHLQAWPIKTLWRTPSLALPGPPSPPASVGLLATCCRPGQLWLSSAKMKDGSLGCWTIHLHNILTHLWQYFTQIRNKLLLC